MTLNYQKAAQYKGKFVKFQNEKGEWVAGKVVDVEKDEFIIEAFDYEQMNDLGGAGYPFWGPWRRPYGFGFRRRPFFRPYGYRRAPFAGVFGLTLLPFLLW